jgi:S-formylglutathione hydrolase FrmB
MFGTNAAKLAANDPERHIAAAKGLHIFLAEATYELGSIGGQTRQFARLLAADHIPATLDVRPGRHDWPFVRAVLPDLFAFLARSWPGN